MARIKSQHGCQKARSKQVAHRKIEAINAAPPKTKRRRRAGVMAAAAEMNDLLGIYFRKHVTFPKHRADKNRKIANKFVESFKEFVLKNAKLEISHKTQGSSFEGLKSGAADEFDYLLLLDDAAGMFAAPPQHDPTIDEMKKSNQLKWALNCYHRLGPQTGTSLNNRLLDARFAKMVEEWPRGGGKKQEICLSSRLTIKAFHDYAVEFVAKKDENMWKKMGVRAIQSPECRHPALKTIIYLTDRTHITVDMSMAVRFKTPAYSRPERACGEKMESNEVKGDGYSYYIAKKKPALNLVQEEAFQMLWLDSYSQEEKELFEKQTTEDDRDNLRIMRSLFSDVQINYVWKTLFMMSRPFPGSSIAFVTKMVEKLVLALRAEIHEREKEETRKCANPRLPLEIQKPYKDCDENLLLSHFNNCENVLARYDVGKIKGWLADFAYLHTKLATGRNPDFIMTKLKLAQITEDAYMAVVYFKTKK